MRIGHRKNNEYFAVLEGHRLAQPTIYPSWSMNLEYLNIRYAFAQHPSQDESTCSNTRF
jgi:hypothetical protein